MKYESMSKEELLIEIQKMEKKFDNFFEQAGSNFMILDPNTSDGIPIIIEANEAICSAHGYTREELVGRPVADIDDAAGRLLVKKNTAEIMTGRPFYTENVHVRRNGTTFNAAVYAKSIDLGDGYPLIFTNEYDITKRKEEEKLKEENAKRLELSLLSGNAGTWTWDVISGEVCWDVEMQRIFGLKPGEFNGTFQHWKDLVHPEDLEEAEAATIRSMEEGVQYKYEYRVNNKDDKFVTVQAHAITIKDDEGKSIKMIGICQDITDYKNIQNNLIELNLELEQYSFTVSHDLKAPLSGIVTLSDMLIRDEKENLSRDGQENIEFIKKSALKMNQLILDILNYHKIGHAEVEKNEIEIKAHVDEIWEYLNVPSYFSLIYDLKVNKVCFEKTQLREILQNLINNSIVNMDKKVATVKISTRRDKEKTIFSIEDNGPGIEKKYHEKIFIPFDLSLPKKDKNSSGLGLSIVKKILNKNNEMVWLESEIGKGAIFSFSISD